MSVLDEKQKSSMLRLIYCGICGVNLYPYSQKKIKHLFFFFSKDN